jgi:hypothetical protein
MERRRDEIMSSPAGWYLQPDGQQRYWDGEQWTEHFAPGGRPATTGAVNAVGKPSRPWFKKKRVLIPAGLVALFVVAGIAGGGTAPTEVTLTAANTQTTAPAVDTAASEKAAADLALEQAAADKAAADKTAADKTAADKAVADKAAAAKAASDKAAADKAAAAKAASDKAAADKAAAAKVVADKAAADKAAAAKKIEDANRLTTAQENAKRKGESYLEMSGFSRSGLIGQLKFEGFSENDAKRAIDSMKVNWNTEAEQKAKSYVDMTGFSRSGLIEQLKFEGFTNAQATHGADSVGL